MVKYNLEKKNPIKINFPIKKGMEKRLHLRT
jgi:hypothetical protein